VAAVVEYSPVTGTPDDPSADRNVANYVEYIREAAKQVDIL
jgi:hypothetical protein